jgi:steroid 5-alpha reductase family enzyme
MEAVADYQKTQSKADPATKDLWTETGLWRYCRHPNCTNFLNGLIKSIKILMLRLFQIIRLR